MPGSTLQSQVSSWELVSTAGFNPSWRQDSGGRERDAPSAWYRCILGNSDTRGSQSSSEQHCLKDLSSGQELKATDAMGFQQTGRGLAWGE